MVKNPHYDFVAGEPCLVSGEYQVTLHHVTGYSDRMGRFTRSDRLVVPLAARYHLIQHGGEGSVEFLNHRGFYDKYGVDLLAEALRLEAESILAGRLPVREWAA